MKFMGYELKDLEGSVAILKDGRVARIKSIKLIDEGTDFPFFITFYNDELDDTYSQDGKCSIFDEGCEEDIASIDLFNFTPKELDPSIAMSGYDEGVVRLGVSFIADEEDKPLLSWENGCLTLHSRDSYIERRKIDLPHRDGEVRECLVLVVPVYKD